MASFINQLKHAWNTFTEDKVDPVKSYEYGPSYSSRQDRARVYGSNERTIVSAVYTRMGIDAASVDLQHVRHDRDGGYLDVVNSGLNNCLTVEANLDQGARAFKLDAALSMFNKGVIAIVPIDTTLDPTVSGAYEINTMRVGEIVAWMPEHVTISVYNQRVGHRVEITRPKSTVAIAENPFYAVMNEPNSTLQRLIRKLALLDAIDEQSGAGKLDLIIQLPYVIKTETKRAEANKRREEIEMQLKGNKFGIAYADGTEKITQLNRPVENNLLGQIEYLTNMLYGQLGLTPEILLGTADEATMINYYNRTIEPILASIVEAINRSFLTKTARTQGQSVEFYRDPFKLMTVASLAETADKLTRNEILSSNEFRSILGRKPRKDPGADELRNKNLPVQEPLDLGNLEAAPTEQPLSIERSASK